MPGVAAGDTYTFGPFTLDVGGRRLTKNDDVVALSGRHFDLLCLLVARAGELLSKDVLSSAGWPDVAVGDNSVEQAISLLRRTLPPSYIETEARRGYRFTQAVTKADVRQSDEALEALLAPHRAFVEGRAALETLDREQIARARTVFASVLAQAPEQASAHVGLANACIMQFETTRAEPRPDVTVLGEAMVHAREACRIDAGYGEAWATLGLVLDRTGRNTDAIAAVRRAVALEPDNWRHHVRLAYTSWGEERLRGARRTLTLFPGFPIGHWLAATVLIARQAYGEAERELETGLESGQINPQRFSGVALHWLRGLLAMVAGDDDLARAHFARELQQEHGGHLYARECCANTWYALGALECRRGERELADRAFAQTLDRIAAHPCALAARSALHGEGLDVSAFAVQASSVDRAIASAVHAAVSDTAAEATVAAVHDALAAAPPGSAGWLLPIEPMLHVAARPERWAAALTTLRHRAA